MAKLKKAVYPVAGRERARKALLSSLNKAELHRAVLDKPDSQNSPLIALVTELRNQLFLLKAETLPVVGSIYGLVIETGMVDRVTTLAVLSDGSTSWYVSSGHGCLGCGDDAKVNQAAKQLIMQAGALVAGAYLVDVAEKPLPDCTQIHLLTQQGLRCIDVESHSDKDVLASVLDSAQRLLQLIERNRAGVSLEEELAAQFDTAQSENKTCSSVGNAVRRSRN